MSADRPWKYNFADLRQIPLELRRQTSFVVLSVRDFKKIFNISSVCHMEIKNYLFPVDVFYSVFTFCGVIARAYLDCLRGRAPLYVNGSKIYSFTRLGVKQTHRVRLMDLKIDLRVRGQNDVWKASTLETHGRRLVLSGFFVDTRIALRYSADDNKTRKQPIE